MPHPEVPEGYEPGPGDPVAVRFSRSDLALLRRAAAGKWNVPDAVQTEAIFQIAKILADDGSSKRHKLSAALTLAALTRCDLDADRIALARERLKKPDKAADADARAALLAEAEGLVAEKQNR